MPVLATTLPRRACAFLWVLAAVIAGGAHAADPPKPGFGKGKGPLLSLDELRACLAQQDRVRIDGEALQKAQSALNDDKAAGLREEEAITESLATLDRTSADAVSAYSARVEARSKMIDDYNARSAAFNVRVEALRSNREAFAKSCDNRRFDEKDEMAIRNGK